MNDEDIDNIKARNTSDFLRKRTDKNGWLLLRREKPTRWKWPEWGRNENKLKS